MQSCTTQQERDAINKANRGSRDPSHTTETVASAQCRHLLASEDGGYVAAMNFLHDPKLRPRFPSQAEFDSLYLSMSMLIVSGMLLAFALGIYVGRMRGL